MQRSMYASFDFVKLLLFSTCRHDRRPAAPHRARRAHPGHHRSPGCRCLFVAALCDCSTTHCPLASTCAACDPCSLEGIHRELCDSYFVMTCVRNVNNLNWLLVNGYKFPAPGQNLGGTFDYAVLNGDISVLDWLLKNCDAKNITKSDWSRCFIYASEKGFIEILDWLAENLSKLTITKIGEEAETSSPIQTRLLHDSFRTGQVDVIHWWLCKSGPYKGWFDLDYGYPYMYVCKNNGGVAQLAALQAWLAAGRPIDFAKCINNASVNGRIDVLDWLRKSACVSKDFFIKAWTSEDFPDKEQWYYDWWYDEENHGQSLLWWRANMPEVYGMPINRGPYVNPIHAHTLKYVMCNTSFELLEPFDASGGDNGGQLSILSYWKEHGDSRQFQEDCSWCLEGASSHGYCHVLEWWKTQSGLVIECPQCIAEGRDEISIHAKQWWAQSGLVDDKQVAQMKTR